jgi:hypothetical protein
MEVTWPTLFLPLLPTYEGALLMKCIELHPKERSETGKKYDEEAMEMYYYY